MHGEKPRQIALRLLQREAGGDFIENRLAAALAQTRLSAADRHLCQELAYGVVRWQGTLDWLIARKTDARELKPTLKDAGLLTRDSRIKERKKYGLLGARKAPQYHKR